MQIVSKPTSVVFPSRPVQNKVKTKISFKQVEPPVLICYCLNVSEEEIMWHVAVEKCCSTLEDIQKHTGANTGKECLTKNPAGG